MLPPISSLQQQQPSTHNKQTDMDMDIDTEDSSQTQLPKSSLTLDKHNALPPNGPQALEDYRNTADTITHLTNAHTPTPESTSRQHSRHPSSTDQKSSSPISMSTNARQDRNETSSSSLSSGTIVSPPSSYSSNASSSMDALAKTLSPARVDIHRKRIQRMLQQNSLLWWELVRYTRNLERSERELEREKEQEQTSAPAVASGATTSAGTTKARGLHLYHHHHHHHHHHPSLPPLHPQQQALSRSLVAPSKGSSSSRSQSRSHPYDSAVHRDQNYPTQRPRWPTAETVDYRRSGRPNSSHMEQDGCTEEGAGAGTGGMDPDHEPLPSKYSSASQSPSPVSTPPPTQQTFDTPVSKRYGDEPLQEESPSAFQNHRDYYPHSRRHRHYQEGRSTYSAHLPHQQDHYQPHQRRRYDSEAASHRYPSHPSSAPSPHPDSRYESGSATPTTSTSKRLPPMDANRIDAASNGALNAVHSSGPSSTASSPRSREPSSASTVYQNPHHRGPSDPRYHSSYHTSSHHEPAPPPPHQQQPLSTPFGSRRTAPSPSDFSPHSHHNPHHHQHPQHYSHNSHQQPLTSRPSASPHPKIEPLPRPVPVKPASFVSPSALSSISPAPPPHHPRAPSASASSSPVARTTPPTAVAAAATTGGHHHHIRGIDPSAAASATSSSSTHPGSSGGAQPPSSTHTDPNSNNGNNVDPNRKRRGNLPKSVTSVLKSWLVQNAIHPYPTEEEKMRLSEATQLSMNQISNWFINARRRILQPILHEAAAAAVAGTDAPVENVLIVRKGKGSRMHVEMEGVVSGHPGGGGGGGPSSSHQHQHQHPVGHGHNHGHHQHNESESNEESVSLPPVKSASHSSSPQPQAHNQSHPQPILSS
ncbi:MAG: hypothetical protein JOS17DRAFT_735862 [Linnemannia elongata]|nr:MAG: hypothetical protein JOS17DRAFT_735862 [Linnemannia elongata]